MKHIIIGSLAIVLMGSAASAGMIHVTSSDGEYNLHLPTFSQESCVSIVSSRASDYPDVEVTDTYTDDDGSLVIELQRNDITGIVVCTL